MDKLNFANIVDKQLSELTRTKYLESKQDSNDSTVYSKWNKALAKSAKSHTNATENIQYKIDSIVAYVHTKLHERNTIQKSKPIPMHNKPFKTTIKAVPKTPAGNIIIDNPNNGPLRPKKTDNAPVCKVTNIPRIKALCDQKEKKRIHHSIPPPSDKNNFTTQQRFEEAKRQHKVFENMIEDQKQLRMDRESIAAEIYTMRSCLDDIRGRLDHSLKKLEDNKTYSAMHKWKMDAKSTTALKARRHPKSTKKAKS